ncbi:ATP-binding protein [Rhodococcus erythropolis]|uniref:ATP-binding protein n=1 Tax=Rhodococcus erythropolis TaxID=1833 RepID=UPI0037FF9B70
MTGERTSDYEGRPAGVLVELSGEGLAVLDGGGRYSSVNPAGCSILGHAEAELVGRMSIFFRNGHHTNTSHSHEGSEWIGTSEVEYEMRQTQTEKGQTCWALRFWYADRAVQDRRKLAAFTRTVAAVAYENQLDVVLDKLAIEVRDTVGMATCAVILVDEVTGALNHAGKAGLPDDYAERIEACRLLGAPLVTMTAINERRVVVARKWREQILTDPRWEPVQDIARAANWDTYVVVPLIVREKVIGAVAGYVAADHNPGRDDIRFIAAMADQAAIAVANARMFAKLELQAAREERRKLARDMHDSVTQALFSLSLRTKALELGVESGAAVDIVEQLRQLHDLVCGAQAEMRALIMHRRPAPLGEEGLIPSIRKHLAAIAAREGIDLSVESNDEFYQFDEALQEDLFMIVGEAIHNVVKHAHATRATVRIDLVQQQNKHGVCVSVIDNGIGITKSESDHQSFGLVSMSERLKAHGGHLTVRSKPVGDPDHGTTVCGTVPLTRPTGVANTNDRGQEQ